MYLYTYNSINPNIINDPNIKCQNNGFTRSFIFEGSNDNDNKIGEEDALKTSLVEVLPMFQKYHCLNKSTCTLAISGNGLTQEDMIYLHPFKNNNNENKINQFSTINLCPIQEEKIGPFKGAISYETLELVIGDNMQLKPKKITTVIFPIPHSLLKQKDEDNLVICYSPARSRQYKDTHDVQLFRYTSGIILFSSRQVFSCDFEHNGYLGCSFNSLIDLHTKTRFQLGNGNDNLVGLSPPADVTTGKKGEGHFVYFKSPGFMPGASAVLIGNPRVYSFGIYCLTLNYYMAGADVNVLRIYMSSGLLGSVRLTPKGELLKTGNVKKSRIVTQFGRPNWLVVGQQGPNWKLGGFEFYSDGTIPLRLVIEGVAGKSEDSLIGIDDISITSGHCQNEIIKMSEMNNERCIWGETRLITTNFTTEKSWNVAGTLGCSGRTYSFESIKIDEKSDVEYSASDWIPCCLPGYGNYTVSIYDSYGDGWSRGNYLEFRFFDEVIRVGDLFNSGKEMKTNLLVGLINILEIKPSEKQVDILIKANKDNILVWCVLVKAGSVPPMKSVIKSQKNISNKPLSEKEEYRFSMKSSLKGELIPNTEYDIYCHAEGLKENILKSSKNELLSIGMSKMRITTDSISPNISFNITEIYESFINIKIESNETGIVWCNTKENFSINELTNDNYIKIIREGGVQKIINNRDVNEVISLNISDLIPATNYTLICAGEDYALPLSNRVTLETIKSSELIKTFQTKDRIPMVKISRIIAELGKFTVWITSDTPCIVYCAATLPENMYPSPSDIYKFGQTTKILIPSVEESVSLVGVEMNQKYVVYCIGNSLSGLSTPITDVWSNSVDTMSFGKFCDIPSYPNGVEAGERMPFDPLSHLEELQVRNYFENIKDKFNSRGTYRITLFINKTEAYEYLDNLNKYYKSKKTIQLPEPSKRFARVRFGSCDNSTERPDGLNGLYHQWKIGPITVTEDENENTIWDNLTNNLNSTYTREVDRMEHFELSIPKPVECGGFNPTGPFGRRLQEKNLEEELQTEQIIDLIALGEALIDSKLNILVKESCGEYLPEGGIGSGTADIIGSKEGFNHIKRTKIGPVVYQVSNETDVGPLIWVGLTTSDGTQCPIFFEIDPPYSLLTTIKSGSPKIELDSLHNMKIRRFWYNGSSYDTIYDLLKNYVEEQNRKGIKGGLKISNILYDKENNKTISPTVELSENILNSKVELFRNETIHGFSVNEVFNQIMNETSKLMELGNEVAHDILGNQNKTKNIDLVTPEILFDRRVKHEQEMHQTRYRKLQHLDMFSRGGLEIRAKPEHCEPGGRRFNIYKSPNREAYTVKWIGWEFTITNDRDSGLKIWNLSLMGRRIAFEIGMIDAMAHYTVFERQWFFLDSWYGGLGTAARKLHPGLECANTAQTVFWDNSVCVFEMDNASPIRTHWKTGGIKDAAPLTSLVVRQIITVSNYDYIVDLILFNQGSFEMGVRFTGELYAGLEVPYFSARQKPYGTQISPSGQMAALHSHFAVWKVDFDLNDYLNNSISWVRVEKDPEKEGHHRMSRIIAERESNAYYMFNETHHHPKSYFVIDENTVTYGNIGGFMVKPMHTISDLMPDHELYSGPASWTKYQIASSLFKYSELDVNLPRDNKFASKPAVRFDDFIGDDEIIRHRDVVTWITSGLWHIPTLEDVPQTTALGNKLGWYIRPFNWWPMDTSITLHNAVKGDFIEPGTCAIQRKGNLISSVNISE